MSDAAAGGIRYQRYVWALIEFINGRLFYLFADDERN